MNRNKIQWTQSSEHNLNITPYWLLGFVEGEGYFSVNRKTYCLTLGIGQTGNEIDVLIGIKDYLLNLPGNYKLIRNNLKIVSLNIEKKGRKTSRPMCIISISMGSYLTNILVPFFL